MSTTIESVYGSEWTISNSSIDDDGPQVAIDSRSSSGNRVFKVADVLDAMKAEGVLDAVEIITELPEVKPDSLGTPGWLTAGGITMSTKDGAEWHRKLGLNHLAVARHLESEEALTRAAFAEKLEASKAAALSERRSEVALKIGASPYYDDLIQPVRHSVDLIIALEDQLAAK